MSEANLILEKALNQPRRVEISRKKLWAIILLFLALTILTPQQNLAAMAEGTFDVDDDDTELTENESLPALPEIDVLLNQEFQSQLMSAGIRLNMQVKDPEEPSGHRDYVGSGFLVREGDAWYVYTINHNVTVDEPDLVQIQIQLPGRDRSTNQLDIPYQLSGNLLSYPSELWVTPSEFETIPTDALSGEDNIRRFHLPDALSQTLDPELQPLSFRSLAEFETDYFAVVAPQIIMTANQEARRYEVDTFVDAVLIQKHELSSTGDVASFTIIDGTTRRLTNRETGICAGDSGSALVPLDLIDGAWVLMRDEFGAIPAVGVFRAVDWPNDAYEDIARGQVVCQSEGGGSYVAQLEQPSSGSS